MSRRFLLASIQFVVALVLSIAAAAVLQLLLGTEPVVAFLDQGPRLIFTFMDVGLIAWLALLAIGAFRGRGIGFGALGGILAAILASVLNLVVVTVVAFIQGGANIFYIALGIEAGILFLISAIVAVLLAQRIVKPSKAAPPAV